MTEEHKHIGGSFTLAQWCAFRKISRSTYYNLAKVGKAPRIMLLGKKITITEKADADWCRDREAESAPQMEVHA